VRTQHRDGGEWSPRTNCARKNEGEKEEKTTMSNTDSEARGPEATTWCEHDLFARNLHVIVSIVSKIVVSCERSEHHSLRAGAAKLARPNKAKFYLHFASKEKLPCCIPSSPVNFCPLHSKMYIRVENKILHVCVSKKAERFHGELSFRPYKNSLPFPERCVFCSIIIFVSHFSAFLYLVDNVIMEFEV
jgi:hypothetical protein